MRLTGRANAQPGYSWLVLSLVVGILLSSCNTIPGRFAFPENRPVDLRGRVSLTADRELTPMIGPNVEARGLIASHFLVGVSFSSALLWNYLEPYFGLMADSRAPGRAGGMVFAGFPMRWGLASTSGRWDSSFKFRLGAEITYQLPNNARTYLDLSASSELRYVGIWDRLDPSATMGVSWQGIQVSKARVLPTDPSALEQQRAGQDVFFWTLGNYDYFMDANVEFRIPKRLEDTSFSGGLGLYNE